MRPHQLNVGHLPAEVLARVAAEFGPILHLQPKSHTQRGGVAATLTTTCDHTRGARWFLKAIPLDHPARPRFEQEALIAPYLVEADVPHAVLEWHTITAGWLVLVFHHIHGRPANLSAPHDDIHAITRLLGDLALRLTPSPWAGAPPVSERIAEWTTQFHLLQQANPDGLSGRYGLELYADVLADFNPDDLHGETLALFGLNLLRTPDGKLIVVGWERACVGVSWLDGALLVPRLITAGHAPTTAEHLVTTGGLCLPDNTAVDGLAVLWTCQHHHQARYGPPRRRRFHTRAANAGHAWICTRLHR